MTIELNAEQASKYLAQNYPIFCATCTKLPEGHARGLSWCGVQSCGGPMHKDGPRDFPDYNGPIPKSKKATICMKCGHSEIVRQIVINGKRLGLCANHKGLFDKMKFEVVQTGDRKGFTEPTNAANLMVIDV